MGTRRARVTLTVADIDRWDAGDVREVFHAAHSRAQAAFDAADGLATLPALTSFGGLAGAAAHEAIDSTRKDLDAHGNEALAVADAAARAADSIDGIKSDLAQLKTDAENSGLEIDAASNRIVPQPGSTHGRREMQATISGLQARLDSLVDQANATDVALANAINMADGRTPIPASPHENRPEIQAALTEPLPQDPTKFDQLWDQLTPEEKDWLYSRDHSLGNTNGMASTDRDHYNRLTLADELGRAQAAQAQYDALKNQAPAVGDRPNYEAWQRKITDAADLSDTGTFGPNPATNPNFTQLATGPVAVSDGQGGTLNLDGAHGHSDYPRQGGNGLPRSTGYSIAAVIAGLGSTNAIRR
jgi:hypothetical protein